MFLRNKNIYLDYAASTPLDPGVFSAMESFLTNLYANPSALYGPAVAARNAIEKSRKDIAEFLHATNDSIIFTRGGTQSINIALLGIALKHQSIGKHIVTTAIEHHAVLNTLKQLKKEGFEITYLPVDEFGFVTVDQVKNAIREDTILVSVMYANNEIGTIEPVADIGRMILQHRKKNKTQFPYFHTDACQAAGSLNMSVEKSHVDLLSFNGSKIYGPKGVGVLYKRRNVELEPVLFGGGQELGFSPGTEDVAGVVGLGKAVSIISDQRSVNNISELRDYLWNGIQANIDDVVLNGPTTQGFSLYQEDLEGVCITTNSPTVSRPHPTSPDRGVAVIRLPNNLNISFLGTDSEAVILYLDAKGIQVSSGSACTTDSDQVSHVLEACGYDNDRMKSSIRFSLGKSTTKKNIDYVLKVLPLVIEKIRKMNP